MKRAVTLFTGQWADLTLETVAQKAKSFGYDGLELACWGDHIEVDKADQAYCDAKLALLKKYDLKLFSISTHLVGQAVCDNSDFRHKGMLPSSIWGDGDAEGIRQRAAAEIIETGKVAKRLGLKVVNGFTGSSIWPYLYSFPSVSQEAIEDGYKDFAKRWIPILDAYQEMGIKYALEVHPTEIGDNRRFWNFRSVGRGKIDFEKIIRALNDIQYMGPLSVEWEDSGMDREMGASESCEFVKKIDFSPSTLAFDAAFSKE